MKKILAHLFSIILIIAIICLGFVCIYYNVIDTNHTGNMDLWAILLITIPLGILLILNVVCSLLKISIVDPKNPNIFDKTVNVIFNIMSCIILSPLLLVIAIIAVVGTIFNKDRKIFKLLENKGFKKVVENKVYYFKRDNIIIRIPYSLYNYEISFDLGENYIDVVESELGTLEEKNILKEKLQEFLYANPVDIKRGDAKPPLKEYILFLCKYL